ncbi:hypothetical protein [Methylobacterium sp.]|uniref:hypothetical protein n=1 Tax=Methylobacterium sp. TaxID=409 RepID=UPI003C73B653
MLKPLDLTDRFELICDWLCALNPTPTPVMPPGTPWGAHPDHIIVPDALGGGFTSALVGFCSPTLFTGGDPTPGVAAGAQILAANLKSGDSIPIAFQATRAGTVATPYWGAVALLDIVQFLGAGATSCTPLSDNLDALYPINHEMMAT